MSSSLSRVALGASLAISAAAGCHQPAAEPHSAAATAETAPGEADAEGAGSEPVGVTVELRPVDRAAFDAAINEFNGRVVLVDFWATWCAPCVTQLPHTNKLAEQYGPEKLAVVTVSMDEPADAARAAKVIAGKADAASLHLISSQGGGPEAVEAFEIEGGSVPHYKLYDKAGQLRRTFGIDPAAERQFTPEDVDAAVAELLAE